MTTAKREAIAAVQAWCHARGIKLLCRPNHVYPRAYVVEKGYWENCGTRKVPLLRIATPFQDAEPHMQKLGVHQPFVRVDGRDVDASLNEGDWCISAYICEEGNQRNVAVPFPKSGRRLRR